MTHDPAAPVEARALWYAARGRAELRPAPLGPLAPGHVRVATLWSAVSRGTERLVLEGRVPASERERMRAPFQEGAFPFPVKYGYCAVGRVVAGSPALEGRLVFALHPHQDAFDVPEAAARPVPEGVPARRAILAATVETALNAIWDGGVGPGDRVVVVGAGIVGACVARLAALIPGTETTLVDVDPSRRAVAEALGCRFAKPLDAPGEADVVLHASATSAGLACALACAGDEGTIVELSWYGETPAEVSLGLAFHAGRLRLVSSQVGRVSPARRPRWSTARRLGKALDLLADPALDALVSEEVAFDDLAEALPRLLAPGAPGLATAVRY